MFSWLLCWENNVLIIILFLIIGYKDYGLMFLIIYVGNKFLVGLNVDGKF